MKGFQLTFFTQQDRSHQGEPLAHWLVEQARVLGIGGATLLAASEGFGHHRRIHAAHFLELADQPLEVVMAVTAEQADRLFEKLDAEKLRIFYVKAPIEFGTTGERD
jgi:PII-like signaling protein